MAAISFAFVADWSNCRKSKEHGQSKTVCISGISIRQACTERLRVFKHGSVQQLGTPFSVSQIMHRLVMDSSHLGFVPKHLAVNLLQGFRQLSGSRQAPSQLQVLESYPLPISSRHLLCHRLTALLCYLAAYALTKDPACTPKQKEFTFRV